MAKGHVQSGKGHVQLGADLENLLNGNEIPWESNTANSGARNRTIQQESDKIK